MDQNLLDACIHCGLCLPACPTYLATGRELESPRGRIYLLNLYQQQKEPFSPRMAEHLDSCLGCLGCQTACPSGVNYEAIFNQARIPVNDLKPGWIKAFRYLIFKFILPNHHLLIILGNFLRLWQKINGEKVVTSLCQTTQLIRIPVVKELLRWQALLPPVPVHEDLAECINTTGKDVLAVQLFKGCIMDIFYNHVNQAAVGLLGFQSKTVCVPEQSCCGALAFHAGEKDLACKLAKDNIEHFSNSEGPIIVTASGCTAMLKTYSELFADDDPWHSRAKEFANRIEDLPEFLAKHPLPSCHSAQPTKFPTKPIRIAYHAACHLAHAQGIRLAPKQLLENFAKSINEATGSEAVQLVPLNEEEHCCGSAGIYNLTHPDLSDKVLDRKIDMIKETGADLIVTTNPGCLLQLQAGIRNQALDIEVIHLAELLAKGY